MPPLPQPKGTPEAPVSQDSVLYRIGKKYGVDARQVFRVLRESVFRVAKGEPPFSDAELGAALIIADQYDLNPFVNEIYLVRSKDGRLLRMIAIDGWLKIINRHKMFDGMDTPQFIFNEQGMPICCTVTMYRKDRNHPISMSVWYEEAFRDYSPVWKNMPRHMLQVKALKLCARVAFGISGVDDEEEYLPPGSISEAIVKETKEEGSLPRPSTSQALLPDGTIQGGAGFNFDEPVEKETVPARQPGDDAEENQERR